MRTALPRHDLRTHQQLRIEEMEQVYQSQFLLRKCRMSRGPGYVYDDRQAYLSREVSVPPKDVLVHIELRRELGQARIDDSLVDGQALASGERTADQLRSTFPKLRQAHCFADTSAATFNTAG